MALHTIIVGLVLLLVNLNVVNAKINLKDKAEVKETIQKDTKNIDDVFNGVYTECFITFSFPCVQRKTLMYLKQLNNMSEVSVVGDYVKFVKLNATKLDDTDVNEASDNSSETLTRLIDRAVDRFFDNHVIKFSALGRDISIPNNVEEFVGRKKRKGGGGGDGGMMGGHDGGHFGNKKMMMMAMMCMKMKLMMMVPAMMGMMGMMSFKGMMFSMMSFMVAKMMLLMKILEKKGGAGGGGGGIGGGGDGGWAAGGGGGGAWMPAGGQDLGGGGGYDANGQWQSRSILESKKDINTNDPISYKTPVLTYKNPIKFYKTINDYDDIMKVNKNGGPIKSRSKRGIIDVLQNTYMYWMKTLLGINSNRRTSNYPKYKIVNGIKYVFYPYRQQRYKAPKEVQSNKIKHGNEEPSIITAEDFNKGEIVEGAVESRMNRKKFTEMKDTVNETIDDNPWE